MTTSDHDRAARLFLDALEVPTAERNAWLDAACRDTSGTPDAALRAEVASLLAAHEAADYLDAPLLPRDATDPMIGREIGPWRLVERIGEGGMGAVYRAERADGAYERTVALKLLRPGPDAQALADRLRAERQILAGLEHPHIARLYDGGVTPDGLPYLALEYVEGQTLTDAARGLSLGDRIRLVLQICDAVAYAHQRLVIHRDLKPSNVLVGNEEGDLSAKLLDFGIATLVDQEGAGLMTVTGARLLTPAYAAPEQILGQTITTATDVYALGALLYEVLGGQRPYDLGGQTARGIEQIVCDTVPPPPSVVAPASDARRLQGDLDTIVMTALAKEPDRRYAGARALADDLQRHLDALPITARPATLRYRARSFARRNRTGVAAGLFALMALLGGLGVALWQGAEASRARDRAESRFAIAQDAARALLYDVHDAVAGVPGSTTAREVIVTRSIDYLDRLARDAGDDLPLRIDLAEAYLRVGNVTGNPTDANLGQTEGAAYAYRLGLATLPAATTPAPGDTLGARVETTRGRLHEKLGVVLAHTDSLDDALLHLDRAVAAHGRALDANDTPQRRTLLATARINRGDYTGHPSFPNAERPSVAFDEYQEARRLLETIPEGQRDLFALRMLGITYEREGALLESVGEIDLALDALRESAAIREAIAARPDATTDALRDAGVAHEMMGRVLRTQGRPDSALTEFERALVVYQSLLDADPDNQNAQLTLAFGELQLAQTHGGPEPPHRNDPARARQHYRRALQILQSLAEADPANARVRSVLASTEANLRAVGG